MIKIISNNKKRRNKKRKKKKSKPRTDILSGNLIAGVSKVVNPITKP